MLWLKSQIIQIFASIRDAMRYDTSCILYDARGPQLALRIVLTYMRKMSPEPMRHGL